MVKKLIRGIGVMTACLFLFPFSVFAADKSVTLSESGEGVQAFVELPSQETVNPVTSLQISFQVEITKGNAEQAKAEFQFHEAVKSSVKEYRYHADSGILTIYISGKENLFSEQLLSEQKLALGEVVVSTEDTLGVKAKISVVEDSYRFVSANGTQTENESINAPGFVEVTVGNGGVEEETDPTPTPTPGGDPTPTPTPGGDPTPTPGGNPTPTPDPGGNPTPTPDPGGEPTPTPGAGGNPTPTPGAEGGQKPVPSVTPGVGNQSQQTAAETGDEMQPMLYFIVAAAALVLLFMGAFQVKRRR